MGYGYVRDNQDDDSVDDASFLDSLRKSFAVAPPFPQPAREASAQVARSLIGSGTPAAGPGTPAMGFRTAREAIPVPGSVTPVMGFRTAREAIPMTGSVTPVMGYREAIPMTGSATPVVGYPSVQSSSAAGPGTPPMG